MSATHTNVAVVEVYAQATEDFVAAVFSEIDERETPEEADRLALAMSDAVAIIIKVARVRFEKAGMSPEEADRRSIDMVAYAVGDAS